MSKITNSKLQIPNKSQPLTFKLFKLYKIYNLGFLKTSLLILVFTLDMIPRAKIRYKLINGAGMV